MTSTALVLVLLSSLTHPLWNLVSKRSSRTPAFFLLASLFVLGLAPVFVALGGIELVLTAPPRLWVVLGLTGVSQAAYFVFLATAYRHGDISVVYPLARTFPIFVVGIAGLALGQWPTPAAWLGIGLVVLGCAALPLEGLAGGIERGRYLNAASLWALLTALASSGYTVCDYVGVDLVAGLDRFSAPVAALLYGYLEWTSTALFLGVAVVLGRQRGELARAFRDERGPALLVGLLSFGTYLLILWAYSLSDKVAYVAALRQVSIVLGVVFGLVFLGERGGVLRVAASGVVVAGLVLVALAD